MGRGPPQRPWAVLVCVVAARLSLSRVDLPVSFINRVSNTSQLDEPPEFRGGIIADPMGLGKTLTMISLVATDLDAEDRDEEADDPSNGTTLVVVPPP